MQLGMVGLGRMGANMARRLLRAGHVVVAYDRDPAAVKALDRERQRGYSLMLGGDADAIRLLEPVLRALAPGRGVVPATPEHLHLLVVDGLGGGARERLHRHERQELEDVVLKRDEVLRAAVRGQYGGGAFRGVRVPAYRDEPDVAPLSTTETYAAVRLDVDSWRWAGVPFYVRTGKRLARPAAADELLARDGRRWLAG